MAEPEPIRLDELRARLRETQAAAERLAGQIPPQGWASGRERSETAEEIQALVSILSALRAVVPDDLWEQVREIVRQLLLLLRALLDLVVERLGAEPAPGSAPAPRVAARPSRTSRSPDHDPAARLQSASDGRGDAHVIGRLRRALANLASEQRRVALAAALVLVSLLLPWYSKSFTGVDGKGKVPTGSEAKLAIFVPSFVEASIFLVAIAILVLMFFRGESSAFHLPFGDGLVVTAAGAWVGFLVFYRFIDQPAGGKTNNLVYSYDLSWGIFFGLPGRGVPDLRGNPRCGWREWPSRRCRARGRTRRPSPTGGRGAKPSASGRRGRSHRRRASRRRGPDLGRARRGADGPPSGAPDRPEIDGGTQLSFDEQE